MSSEFQHKNLPPEKALLLDCLRLHGHRDVFPENRPDKKFNWPVLREEAIRQGVFPLVFQRLKSLPPGNVPEEEWTLYQEIYLANGKRNLRLAQRLIQILDLLKSRGIGLLPLKGPVLALQAFGDLSARQITDLDFLIQNRDVEEAYSLLGEAGYRTESPLTPRMIRHLTQTGKDFWLRGTDTQLDFHQQIPEGPPSFRLKKILWEDLRPMEFLNYRTQVLSPANNLFLLLIHGTEHGWNTLKVIADLGYFIQATPELDWRVVVSRAQKLRSLRILALGLIMTEKLLGLNFPPELKDTINQDRKSQELAEAIIEGLFNETGENRELMTFQRSFDSLSDRLKYIGYYTLAPRTGDWMTLPLPDPLFPVYYLYRPLHVLAKFGPTILRSFFTNLPIKRRNGRGSAFWWDWKAGG